MPYSKVEIFNLALSEVPAPTVVSENENTAEARACRRFFPAVFNELLEGYNWRFAQRQSALAPVTNDRSDEWAYAYQLPADCGRPIGLVVPLARQQYPAEPGSDFPPDLLNGRPIPYDQMGAVLYTNQEAAVLRYARSDVAVAELPALVGRALYMELASRASGVLTQKDDRKVALAGLANTALERARVADRQRQAVAAERRPDWIAARA